MHLHRVTAPRNIVIAVLYVLYTFFKMQSIYVYKTWLGFRAVLLYEGYKIDPMYCIVYENQYKTCLYYK